jgi:hypothetical protein
MKMHQLDRLDPDRLPREVAKEAGMQELNDHVPRHHL